VAGCCPRCWTLRAHHDREFEHPHSRRTTLEPNGRPGLERGRPDRPETHQCLPRRPGGAAGQGSQIDRHRPRNLRGPRPQIRERVLRGHGGARRQGTGRGHPRHRVHSADRRLHIRDHRQWVRLCQRQRQRLLRHHRIQERKLRPGVDTTAEEMAEGEGALASTTTSVSPLHQTICEFRIINCIKQLPILLVHNSNNQLNYSSVSSNEHRKHQARASETPSTSIGNTKHKHQKSPTSAVADEPQI